MSARDTDERALGIACRVVRKRRGSERSVRAVTHRHLPPLVRGEQRRDAERAGIGSSGASRRPLAPHSCCRPRRQHTVRAAARAAARCRCAQRSGGRPQRAGAPGRRSGARRSGSGACRQHSASQRRKTPRAHTRGASRALRRLPCGWIRRSGAVAAAVSCHRRRGTPQKPARSVERCALIAARKMPARLRELAALEGHQVRPSRRRFALPRLPLGPCDLCCRVRR